MDDPGFIVILPNCVPGLVFAVQESRYAYAVSWLMLVSCKTMYIKKASAKTLCDAEYQRQPEVAGIWWKSQNIGLEKPKKHNKTRTRATKSGNLGAIKYNSAVWNQEPMEF